MATLADVRAGVLPADATGVLWPATGWIDCRAFVESWRFGWELRMEPYDPTTDVEILTAPHSCTDPQWCPTCPDAP
jgi:hypothetical protein